MIKISTKGRYGTRLMINLALRSDSRTKTLKTIAAEEDIPIRYLEQIVIPLKNYGLVRGLRGASGGFVLTRDPKDIKMSEIVDILEGSWCFVECVEDRDYCPKIDKCSSHELWKDITDSITKILENTTLEDMVKLYEKKNN